MPTSTLLVLIFAQSIASKAACPSKCKQEGGSSWLNKCATLHCQGCRECTGLVERSDCQFWCPHSYMPWSKLCDASSKTCGGCGECAMLANGTALTPSPPAPPLLPDTMYNLECWRSCGEQPGSCPNFCGNQKACCRQGRDTFLQDCGFGAAGCADKYCCSPLIEAASPLPPHSPPPTTPPPAQPPLEFIKETKELIDDVSPIAERIAHATGLDTVQQGVEDAVKGTAPGVVLAIVLVVTLVSTLLACLCGCLIGRTCLKKYAARRETALRREFEEKIRMLKPEDKSSEDKEFVAYSTPPKSGS